MKKITYILASAVAMIIAVEANAQIGVGVGYNLESLTTKAVAPGESESESESLNGFYIEATYDWNFIDAGWGALALQPGVRFSFAGDSDKEEILGYVAKESFKETYLDIPVHVKYSYDLGAVKLSAFAGPVFSLGLTSSNKISLEDGWTKYNLYTGKTSSKDFTGDTSSIEGAENEYGRFDLKLGVGLGATFMEKFNVKLGYNIGLLNRYTGEQLDDYKIKYKTGVFYAGIGFSF